MISQTGQSERDRKIELAAHLAAIRIMRTITERIERSKDGLDWTDGLQDTIAQVFRLRFQELDDLLTGNAAIAWAVRRGEQEEVPPTDANILMLIDHECNGKPTLKKGSRASHFVLKRNVRTQ